MTRATVFRCDEPDCQVWGFASDGLVIPVYGSSSKHYCLPHYPRDMGERCSVCSHLVRPYACRVDRMPWTRAKYSSNPAVCWTCHEAQSVPAVPDYTPDELGAVLRLTNDPDVLYALGISTTKEG